MSQSNTISKSKLYCDQYGRGIVVEEFEKEDDKITLRFLGTSEKFEIESSQFLNLFQPIGYLQ